MKKIATLMLASYFFGFTDPLHAQKCKYVKEFKDPFTNNLTKGAQLAVGDVFAGKEVLLKIENGKLFLGLGIVFNDLGSIPFRQGDTVSFKLANDKVINLLPAQDVAPRDINVMNVAAQQWLVLQEVTAETFREITLSPITAVKFRLKNDFFITNIKEKQAAKIMETADCMLQSIQ